MIFFKYYCACKQGYQNEFYIKNLQIDFFFVLRLTQVKLISDKLLTIFYNYKQVLITFRAMIPEKTQLGMIDSIVKRIKVPKSCSTFKVKFHGNLFLIKLNLVDHTTIAIKNSVNQYQLWSMVGHVYHLRVKIIRQMLAMNNFVFIF